LPSCSDDWPSCSDDLPSVSANWPGVFAEWPSAGSWNESRPPSRKRCSRSSPGRRSSSRSGAACWRRRPGE
jgi:hypothetical protein